jgi:CRP-like cAMP-binding protein
MLLTPPAAQAQNRLISLLPPADRKRLLERCEPVTHELEDILAREGETMRYAWFPTTGMISQVQPSEAGWIEIALVGFEGMVGVGLVMGVGKSLVIATVQAPGELLRMPARAFQAELERSSRLRKLAGAYAYVQMKQMALAAACNRFHLVEQRLARWLLMSSDRTRSRRFRMTHDVLAQMLGVRRPGVTSAASALQARNLIRYNRGTIDILDRAALEDTSCECYRAQADAYKQLFG